MKYILYIVLLCSLASCGIFLKVHKESALNKLETSSVVKSDSTGVTIDKSVITVKEKADTSVTIPAKVISQEVTFNMDSLVNGMTAVKNDLIDIRFMLNPLTNKLTTTATIKPQVVPFQIDRETTRQNDITQTGTLSKSTESKSKEEHKTSVVDKQPKNSLWFIVMILGSVLVTGWLAYRYFKR